MNDIEAQWYWDRRTDKAYYPVEHDDGTVTLATVWHADEVTGAIDAGAMVPVEEMNLERSDTTVPFDCFDSFRTPDPADLPGGE